MSANYSVGDVVFVRKEDFSSVTKDEKQPWMKDNVGGGDHPAAIIHLVDDKAVCLQMTSWHKYDSMKDKFSNPAVYRRMMEIYTPIEHGNNKHTGPTLRLENRAQMDRQTFIHWPAWFIIETSKLSQLASGSKSLTSVSVGKLQKSIKDLVERRTVIEWNPRSPKMPIHYRSWTPAELGIPSTPNGSKTKQQAQLSAIAKEFVAKPNRRVSSGPIRMTPESLATTSHNARRCSSIQSQQQSSGGIQKMSWANVAAKRAPTVAV
ncbi:hypothetical protein LTS10_000875 [Elasticomyces elasticus]|nr:hypothetical protein LTS10_000875 [Elasticomyces elasticus]